MIIVIFFGWEKFFFSIGYDFVMFIIFEDNYCCDFLFVFKFVRVGKFVVI